MYSGRTMIAGFVVIQIGAAYLCKLNEWSERNMITEERSSRLGLVPMLLAEKDRM